MSGGGVWVGGTIGVSGGGWVEKGWGGRGGRWWGWWVMVVFEWWLG